MEISSVIELSIKFKRYEKGLDLFEDLNNLTKNKIQNCANQYKPDQFFQPVNLLRFLIADQLLRSVTISSKKIEDIKKSIELRDVSAYYTLLPDIQQKLISYKNSDRGMFPQWKNPFSILYPFFYQSDDKKEIESFLKNLGEEIIEKNKITNSYIHVVGFDGPQNYGAARLWGAVLPEHAPNVQMAYQLFFSINDGKFEAGLNKGHKILNNEVASELKSFSKWSDALVELNSKVESWRSLNGDVDFGFEKDELELKKRISSSDNSSLNMFFSMLDKVLSELNITDSESLVFSTGSGQLSFHIGKRYCLTLKKNYFSFITPDEYKIPDLKNTPFATSDSANFYNQGTSKDIEQHYSAIIEAIQFEVDRDNHTESKDYDNAAFRKAVFDKKYRSSLFEFTEISFQTKNNMTKVEPLNQILYGPPGTGKTYNTINKALAILGESDILETGDRELIKKKFDEYVALGQVVFTTFHQSMSYEDFIEGIKPHTSEEGKVVYEVEDGIFKNISRSAEEASKIKKITGHSNLLIDKELLDKSLFFKVSLGDTLSENSDEIYDWCIKNNRIAVGWGGDIDFKNVKDEKDIKAEFEANGIEIKGPNDYNLIAVKIMMLSMKIGDLVFVSNGNRKLKAIGKIIGDYKYMQDISIPFKQTREVEWLYKDINVPVTDVYSSYFSQASIYQLSRNKIKEQYFINNIKNEDQVNPYVLIIDEINRGNVSQIFGELITLIEEDKRIGAAEEIRVKLPYSKDDEEPFGVPSNLYIIGTMNTADRSVEALDTALRRRFVFEEMLAKPKLLSPFYRLGMAWAKHWEHSNSKEFWEMWYEIEAKISELPDWKITKKETDRINDGLKIDGLKDWVENTDFEEVFRDAVVIGNNGIRLDKMLVNINSRIEILLDKDHQIGHAFFVNVYTKDELKIVFENKILPLLQEYFYGDIGKIALVLGDSFIERVQSDKRLIQSNVYADKDLISVFEEKANYKFTHRDTWDFSAI